MFNIYRTSKSDPDLQDMMRRHYSRPRGFVGRQIFYCIEYNDVLYGCIAFGSATRFLPGRSLGYPLTSGLNNIFYHIEKRDGSYPCRNFTIKALLLAEELAKKDYRRLYGDDIRWIESLVELPRKGEIYLRAGYRHAGVTKGFTCKREAGRGTDSWTGKRVWDTDHLKPKNVFLKEVASV